ncbi:MAG TPA: hypothetical protein VFD78_00810 [Chitinophagaceae bacterium]|nr:hypothetical protein [Chitinophagaceae bacterium]
MEDKHLPELENNLDIKTSKTKTSRFYFLLGLFSILVFANAGCYNLYTQKFKYNDDVEIPKSSLYDPVYEKSE